MNAVDFVHQQLASNKQIPEFQAGDNITVNYKIIEGNNKESSLSKET